MMREIYRGEFVSRDDDGTLWEVAILRDLAVAPEAVGQLDFPDEEPLLIEWTETQKEDVICGSTATLRVLSPGDRTYTDLYTIKAGDVGIMVYRDGLPYWTGTLDPEFYEEPYTDTADYEVELTFSDFGILERLQYGLSGLQTLGSILADALDRARISLEVRQDWISTRTSIDAATAITLDSLSVRSDNFTDEDGEVSNLRDVLEGVLQPLGLRMIQRNGKVWVYDLNGIHGGAGTCSIEWHDCDQVMGVDKVVNNVKITFSPYASAELLDGKAEFIGDYSVSAAENGLGAAPGNNVYSYYPDYCDDHVQGGTGWDYRLIDFAIFLGNRGKGLAYVNNSARWFHILPVTGSVSECDGVAWSFYSGGHSSVDESHHWPKQVLNTMGKISNTVVMKTHRVFLPKLSNDERKDFFVRLSLEMLMDARYNPFSSSTDYNENDNHNNVKVWTGWAFVPVAVTIYDEQGNALCHYDNRDTARGAASGSLGDAIGEWKAGAGSFGDAFLEYYDPNDLAESTGIQGWKANRHCIGRPCWHPENLPFMRNWPNGYVIYDSFKQMADGEYMPYPPHGGYLEVTVFAGVNCYDYGETEDFDTTVQWDLKGLYDKIRWLLYKAPKVEVVRNNLSSESEELEDVEYSGYVNRDAKEELAIDTICGTVGKPSPTAKGLYFSSSDGMQVTQLARQGRSDLAEKLLIGTLYSQYATRHTKLTGTAFLLDGDLKLYTEAMQGERKFLMLADIQDADAGTSEMTVVELSPDEYDAIEYE